MAATTNYGWPIPVSADKVKDGYDAIADLGVAADASLKVISNALNATKVLTVYARRTAGDLSISSINVWADVDNALDRVLPAAVGDAIEVSVSGTWGAQGVYGYLDAVSVVSSAPVNSWALDGPPQNPPTSTGVQSWRGGPYAQETIISGSVVRRLVAGDISGGNVTLRLRVAVSNTNRTLYASTARPLLWHAKNLRAG